MDMKKVLDSMYSVREELNLACTLCDRIQEKGLWQQVGPNSLKDLLRTDLTRYCMYLAGSDRLIKHIKVVFFDIGIGFETSEAEILFNIDKNELYTERFAQEIPLTFELIYSIHENLEAAGIDVEEMLRIFADLFYDMGATFVACDGLSTGQEKIDLNTYMETIYDYVYLDMDEEEEWDEEENEDEAEDLIETENVRQFEEADENPAWVSDEKRRFYGVPGSDKNNKNGELENKDRIREMTSRIEALK